MDERHTGETEDNQNSPKLIKARAPLLKSNLQSDSFFEGEQSNFICSIYKSALDNYTPQCPNPTLTTGY